MNKKFLYHCSHINHGSELVVLRKSPKLTSSGEPDTPRLCVSPSIPQCLSARLFLSSVWVYRTVKPCRGVTPKNVWDEIVTDERWLLPGHKLELFSVLGSRRVRSAFNDVAEWHRRTGRAANLKLRLATLWRACVGFPEYTPPRLARLSNRWCEELKIDPFAIFETTHANNSGNP